MYCSCTFHLQIRPWDKKQNTGTNIRRAKRQVTTASPPPPRSLLCWAWGRGGGPTGYASKIDYNRPFPSSLAPLFQRESKCETILMKMTLICIKKETACKTHFHMKGFALGLVLKQRHKRTRKWPIACHEMTPWRLSQWMTWYRGCLSFMLLSPVPLQRLYFGGASEEAVRAARKEPKAKSRVVVGLCS